MLQAPVRREDIRTRDVPEVPFVRLEGFDNASAKVKDFISFTEGESDLVHAKINTVSNLLDWILYLLRQYISLGLSEAEFNDLKRYIKAKLAHIGAEMDTHLRIKAGEIADLLEENLTPEVTGFLKEQQPFNRYPPRNPVPTTRPKKAGTEQLLLRNGNPPLEEASNDPPLFERMPPPAPPVAPPPVAPLTITTETIGPYTVNTPIKPIKFTGTGGTGNVTWTADTLPPGLTLSTDGNLSGTPTMAGKYNSNITFTSEGRTISKKISIIVYGVLTIAAPQMNFTVGVNISPGQQFTATGGKGPYSWAATDLPPGLTLSRDGTLPGTPENESEGQCNITLTDSTGRSVSESVSYRIDNPLDLTEPIRFLAPVHFGGLISGVTGTTNELSPHIVNNVTIIPNGKERSLTFQIMKDISVPIIDRNTCKPILYKDGTQSSDKDAMPQYEQKENALFKNELLSSFRLAANGNYKKGGDQQVSYRYGGMDKTMNVTRTGTSTTNEMTFVLQGNDSTVIKVSDHVWNLMIDNIELITVDNKLATAAAQAKVDPDTCGFMKGEYVIKISFKLKEGMGERNRPPPIYIATKGITQYIDKNNKIRYIDNNAHELVFDYMNAVFKRGVTPPSTPKGRPQGGTTGLRGRSLFGGRRTKKQKQKQKKTRKNKHR